MLIHVYDHIFKIAFTIWSALGLIQKLQTQIIKLIDNNILGY